MRESYKFTLKLCHVTSILMPRFLTGDELGSIKSVSYDPNASSANQLLLKTVHDSTSTGRTRGIQRLAISPTLVRASFSSTNRTRQNNAQGKLASAHTDGTIYLASLTGDDAWEQRYEWKETRFKGDHPFVGLALTQK